MTVAPRLCFMLTTILLLLLPASLAAQPTLYIVRHAEKLDGWPEREHGPFHPLSDRGIATAHRLAAHFAATPVAAIFSSPTTRSLHTAYPLSHASGIPLQAARAMMDTSAIDEFLRTVASDYTADQAVLLVTHSNIIPYILIKLGLAKECFEAMDIHPSSTSRWLLAEKHENLYVVKNWGGDWLGEKEDGCAGIQVVTF
jgi:phosphohistidine phosphatase SixA